MISSCADYEIGYLQGYENVEKQNWLLFGRQAYELGYEEGHMQYFQDDWYAENAAEMVVAKMCPVAGIRPRLALQTDFAGLIDLN